MLDRLGSLRRPDPVIFVIVALLCASTLVVYLQHRALVALDRQTDVILQKIAEQTVTAAVVRIRETFDGPVFSTLPAVNHPLVAAGRFDLLAEQFAKGLRAYPQVERFFVWSDLTEPVAPGEVVFLGTTSGLPVSRSATDPLHFFGRDPALGRRILAVARRHSGSQRIYAAVTERVNDTPYDIFVRLLYTDAERTRFFAVLGFVVNLEAARTQWFPAIYERRLVTVLDAGDGGPRFELRVLDENGVVVFGAPTALPAVSARSRFALQFYPADDIQARMAASVPPREWTAVVSPRTQSAPTMIASTRTQSYWLSGLSVLLMFVALSFAVQGRKRAAQLGRMQSEFVAHVSHQLKTPVSLLSAVAETMALDRVRSPEKLAQCVDIVRGESSRLSVLVDRILEFSRIDDRRRRYEFESVNLSVLVRESVDAFAQALARSGYRIEVEEENPPAVVVVDPAALEQALVNLLDNAVKYGGEARHVTVRIRTTRSDAIIEVIDRGVGIDEAEQGRIFERFYRGSAATGDGHGFGLGLAIANELVRAQRGQIEVESRPGVGSTFRIRIPLMHGTTGPRGWRSFWFVGRPGRARLAPRPKGLA